MKAQTAKTKESGWPVNFLMAEDATWGYDRMLHGKLPSAIRGIAKRTLEQVKQYDEAVGSFDKLCKAGCHQITLLFLLGTCENRGVQSATKLTGYDSEELASKLAMMRECANTLAEINHREFGLFVKDRRHFRQYERLPELLRKYAALVQHAVTYLGGKTDFYLHVAKGRLIHYVFHKTGSYHDKDVAELLAAALGTDYSEPDHRSWRNTYHKRIHTYTRGADTPVLRVNKTLLERRAASLYRADSILSTAPIRKVKKDPEKSGS